jgi:hypothetical protein
MHVVTTNIKSFTEASPPEGVGVDLQYSSFYQPDAGDVCHLFSVQEQPLVAHPEQQDGEPPRMPRPSMAPKT